LLDFFSANQEYHDKMTLPFPHEISPTLRAIAKKAMGDGSPCGDFACNLVFDRLN
jgi:hypothetical protein